MATGTPYSLTVYNNSTLSGNVCMYQRDPQQDVNPNLFTLAWIVKSFHPGTKLVFNWDIVYGLTWLETGVLNKGVRFTASETREIDLTDPSKNAVSLVKEHGAYRFTDSNKIYPTGTLGIHTDNSIPTNGLSLGVTMSGQPAFAMPATPNYSYCFEPHPEYYIAFGNFEQGEVIDVNTVSSTQRVQYPFGVFDEEVSFETDNTWKL